MVAFAELVSGRLVARDNRFRATVCVAGREVPAHVPNSGRLRELLTPGREVWLAPAAQLGRKTAFDLALVQLPSGLVSIDARLPNALFAEALAPHWLGGSPEHQVAREVRLGGSRLDFLLTSPAGRCWVEVKSVTLVHEGVALFPDAPTARGARHVHELQRAAEAGEGAAVVFIIQRADATCFQPYAANDPALAAALVAAQMAGVVVRAYRCWVSTAGIRIADEIPVEWPS